MRIAFITPQFITDMPNGGGLGNYLFRIGKLLVERGHQVEVFVSSNRQPRVLTHEGIRVERVPPFGNRWLKIVKRTVRFRGLDYAVELAIQAWALAAAMQRRHELTPFDIVQSADFLAVGLAVRRVPGRVHLVRCSTAADLWNEVLGLGSTMREKWRERMERATLRRADKVYAPSQFVADHYGKVHGIRVEVLRPPLGLEVLPAPVPLCGLPDRFLFHFGSYLNKKTGTPWLAQALKIAFEAEPSLRMVWVGRGNFDEIALLQGSLGRHQSRLQVLYPLAKPELYAVLRRADATVLPSMADNLPNTVIESLTLGVPVIGTQGASIDELVEDGLTGELVPPGDVQGLAAAMIRFWRGESAVRKGFTWAGDAVNEMQPQRAVENLLKLAGRGFRKEASLRLLSEQAS